MQYIHTEMLNISSNSTFLKISKNKVTKVEDVGNETQI